MKKLLNTLYVSRQGAYMGHEGQCVYLKLREGEQEKSKEFKFPIHTLSSVVVFGQVSLSPSLMSFCASHGVGITYLSENGRFLARVQGPISGNVLLRRAQYKAAEDGDSSLRLASAIVAAKVANSRTVLRRARRDHPDYPGNKEMEQAIASLGELLTGLSRGVSDMNSLRGWEGEAGRIYFSVFDYLLLPEQSVFRFINRNRRPPLDRVNALLSFVYTLLAHDVVSALETVGLDPQMGFLHQLRPGRPSLALDLMEEMRPLWADRLVINLINRRELKGENFEVTESGAVHMDNGARKKVLTAYQEKKKDELTHPFLEEKIPLGLLPHVSAQLLARFLRGDYDAYPPFFWR
ncbi:MAG: type I-C CRISPR-associated endonuclease Cas1c [Desulfarculales bacterium]|jgi:CRISPR-associated protein Cas1|nr:type I-C CRISPR-associated endonuclease Cas1c [Desulfarculales bacterium]